MWEEQSLAGLSGCFHSYTTGLFSFKEDEKGCTEKRRAWNQPQKKKVDARLTNLVTLA